MVFNLMHILFLEESNRGVYFLPFCLLCIDLLYELKLSGVGCFWDDQFVGALTYTDDLTLLAPSAN